ncbi:hypothetical protein [Streptococcus gallolyticus]|uniref:hypothetical protein n=1 Tax=Streptococcus gallolyticus TaxID=315405 RepID=UPI003D2FD071
MKLIRLLLKNYFPYLISLGIILTAGILLWAICHAFISISKYNTLALFKQIDFSYIVRAGYLMILITVAIYGLIFLEIQLRKVRPFHPLYSQFMDRCHQKIFEWYPIFAIILFLLLVFPENTFSLLATLLSTIALLNSFFKKYSSILLTTMVNLPSIFSLRRGSQLPVTEREKETPKNLKRDD